MDHTPLNFALLGKNAASFSLGVFSRCFALDVLEQLCLSNQLGLSQNHTTAMRALCDEIRREEKDFEPQPTGCVNQEWTEFCIPDEWRRRLEQVCDVSIAANSADVWYRVGVRYGEFAEKNEAVTLATALGLATEMWEQLTAEEFGAAKPEWVARAGAAFDLDKHVKGLKFYVQTAELGSPSRLIQYDFVVHICRLIDRQDEVSQALADKLIDRSYQTSRVVLAWEKNGSPCAFVDGEEAAGLTPAQAVAIQALIDTAPRRLSMAELDHQCSASDSRKHLRKLAETACWQAVLLFPGQPTKGLNGYGIR